MRWCVDIGRPYEADLKDEDFDEIAGTFSESSGSGFGYRDQQYMIKGRRRAQTVATRCEALLNAHAPGEEYDSQSMYVAVYWLPKSILLYRVKYELVADVRNWLRKVQKGT
jgi:hypothetical protein